MTPVTRAILVLDQASGAIREDEGRILGLDLYPPAAAAAQPGFAGGVEMILAVPGLSDAAFEDARALEGFAAGMRVVPLGPLVYGGPSHGGSAALAAGEPATALIAADRRLRGEAAAVGFVPAPHVALLPLLARGVAPVAARIAGSRAALERLAADGVAVPLQLQAAPAGPDWALFTLCDPALLVEAALRGLTVAVLPCDPGTEDLVWARLDQAGKETRTALEKRRILYAEPGQVLIALGPGEDDETFHAHGAHGHAEFLAPDPGLLAPARRGGSDLELADLEIPSEVLERVTIHPTIRRLLTLARPACATVTGQYAADLDRYAGAAPLDATGTIASRHTAHPDNARAEAQLLADLTAMGYCAWRHDFTHGGRTRSNIIADLPGTGWLRIRPELLDRLRRILHEPILRDAGPPGAPGPIPPGLDALVPDGLDAAGLARMSDAELRRVLERILQLRPWYPWWKLRFPVPGIGAELVVLGAHMDSTAGFDPGYAAAADPAPGRDDNASGTAGILSLARYFRARAGHFTHTLRFCFFNAEESGLVGSKAYAAHLKALGAPVRAVLCMDMIGYNSDAHRLFEVHAGYTDPAIRDLSLPLADRVAAAAAEYGTLAPAQIYRGTGYGGAPDRTVYDGAINRSDHAAFHQQGYGAVLVSEDFFVNLPGEPGADPNPHYHRAADQTTDLAYARDIVCAVARAATLLAL